MSAMLQNGRVRSEVQYSGQFRGGVRPDPDVRNGS